MHEATWRRANHPDVWIAVLRQMEADAPATFLYAMNYVYAVNRRFTNVTIAPHVVLVDDPASGRPRMPARRTSEVKGWLLRRAAARLVTFAVASVAPFLPHAGGAG